MRLPDFTQRWLYTLTQLWRSRLGMRGDLNFHPYRVEYQADGTRRELGPGGMGVTFKGYDPDNRRPVALKIIQRSDHFSESSLERFRKEFKAAKKCEHPNIAEAYYFNDVPSNYFYAMEFIDGETLGALCKRVGRLPALSALPLMAQLASALTAVHARKMVHRDLHPRNVMLVRAADGQPLIKLIDFGLVKFLRSKGGSSLSSSVIGTYTYASPEQISAKLKKKKDSEAKSDMYSFGVLLWYMLAGKPPFHGDEKRQRVEDGTVRVLPFERLQGQPKGLIYLLQRLLDPEPDGRPDSVTVENELRRILASLAQDLDAVPAIPLEILFARNGSAEDWADASEMLERPVAFETVERMLRLEGGELFREDFFMLAAALSKLVDTVDDETRLYFSPDFIRVYPFVGERTPDDDGHFSVDFTNAHNDTFFLQIGELFEEETPAIGAAVPHPRSARADNLLGFVTLCYEMLGGRRAWTNGNDYHPLLRLDEAGNDFFRVYFKFPDKRPSMASSVREIFERIRPMVKERKGAVSLPPSQPAAKTEPAEPTNIVPPALPPLWEQPLLTGRLLATAGASLLLLIVLISVVPSLPMALPWRVALGFFLGTGTALGVALEVRILRLKLRLRVVAGRANKGDTDAQAFLGDEYLSGRYCALSYELAFDWHLMAAKQQWRDSQYRVALMYEAGRGTLPNGLQASGWLLSAAKKGHPEARQKALDRWRLYSDANPEEWQLSKFAVPGQAPVSAGAGALRRKAARGDVPAQFRLARCLARGEGMPKDDVEAAHWYRLAAERGHPAAQNNLGVLYATGCGVRRNEKCAADWYARAAESGNAFAMYNLAQCHVAGRGVKRDREKAHSLVRKAAARHHRPALDGLRWTEKWGKYPGSQYGV